MKTLLSWILGSFRKRYDTGLKFDTRPSEEKEQDWLHEEIVADASASVYRTKSDIIPITQKYFKENQLNTYSCVAHGDTLALGIDNEIEGGSFKRLSKAFFYRLRANFPEPGMEGNDAGRIGRKVGSCLYETLPTPATEEAANGISVTPQMYSEAESFKSKDHVSIAKYNDIDVLNSVASQGKAVPIMIFATYREWAQEYPKVLDVIQAYTAPIRHEVCILPNSGFIENGVRYVTVQDSAWFGGYNVRFVSESFIKARCFYAKYYLNLENPKPSGTAPKHIFSKPMYVNDNNEEVRWLQKCLVQEGIHPANAVTGYFGGITLASVKKFQAKYAREILMPLGLTEPTGVVGIATIAMLNKLYA